MKAVTLDQILIFDLLLTLTIFKESAISELNAEIMSLQMLVRDKAAAPNLMEDLQLEVN
jgi:hypothetical protein